jgi:hypothetical protein
MGVVVGLTFLFGFGNVLNLGLRLGVPVWVAPLGAPAVDLSILGLLLGARHLALAGASVDVFRPARRLLIFTSLVTRALNVAGPLVAGEIGKAAFDAVGPLLLIGWAEVGAGFLQAISGASLDAGNREPLVPGKQIRRCRSARMSSVGNDICHRQRKRTRHGGLTTLVSAGRSAPPIRLCGNGDLTRSQRRDWEWLCPLDTTTPG